MSDVAVVDDRHRVTFRMLSKEAHTALIEAAWDADMPVSELVRLAVARLLEAAREGRLHRVP
jgi:hypothetical protein